MKISDYRQLKQQAEERYKNTIAFAEQERTKELLAIETVWNMLHKPKNKRQPENVSSGQNQPNEITGVNLITPKYGDLASSVNKALEKAPNEFTKEQILQIMKQISDNPNIKWNPSSVSGRLQRLVKDGTIKEIKKGHGGSPSVYQKKNISPQIESNNNNNNDEEFNL